MSLGSQQEAETIFEHTQRWKLWRQQETNNGYALFDIEQHELRLRRHEREPEWYTHPGEFEGRYPFGPNIPEPKLPEGWRYLASGVARKAFLSPTGVVYKIQHDPESAWQGNKQEHETAQRLRKSGHVVGAIIPDTALYEVPGSWVIALEFMDGVRQDPRWEVYCTENTSCVCGFIAGRCSETIRRDLVKTFRLSDLHNENVLWVPSQRQWAVVDLGCMI